MSFSNLSLNDQEITGKSKQVPLVILVGPTAVGKSEIAIQLAEHLEGEIVSADSRLFYRGMDIGTAKPSLQDQQRVPHHLIDIADPDETLSLAQFQHAANRIIREIYSRQHLPMMVGGTGQFVRSVTEGWNVPRVEPNLRLRQVLEDWASTIGALEIHTKLAILDPPAAHAIDYRNTRRTIRALEVIFSTGRPFSDQKQSGHQLYRTLTIGLTRPRQELYQRIDRRIDEMFSAGLVEEVQHLLDKGYPAELSTMSAIGYGEVSSYIHGMLTLDEVKMIMKRRTRNYVRRQANWFKASDPDIRWFQVSDHSVIEIEQLIDRWCYG
jgi:tRNA dimethylallyltransferase